MGQVDEIHQPERDGEPARHDEQQHAVRDTVEQDGQHGRARALGPLPACGERVASSVAARRVRGNLKVIDRSSPPPPPPPPALPPPPPPGGGGGGEKYSPSPAARPSP